ncbi:MAG: metallophosphatase domain-containing protein [Bacteroidota bacterium]
MKIIFISDTHGLHKQLKLPKGDVLIHGGDITEFGKAEEVIDFLQWFEAQDFSYKIFIGGNHDIFLDEFPVEFLEMIPEEVTYLRHNSVDIEGIKIWGSPTTPDMLGWAFGKHRKDMHDHWRHMPKQMDILLTHTPPMGILDKSSKWQSLGCEALLRKVVETKPKYHLFGHIHASYGEVEADGIKYANGSNLDSLKGLVNPPIIIDYF